MALEKSSVMRFVVMPMRASVGIGVLVAMGNRALCEKMRTGVSVGRGCVALAPSVARRRVFWAMMAWDGDVGFAAGRFR